MKTLHFNIKINAPKKKVWDTMLNEDTYKIWASVFMPGSYYQGSWEQGGKIKFLDPAGDGMSSVIEENKKYDFISIKHLGFIKNGIEDTESAEVRSWLPSYEKYFLYEKDGSTELKIEMESVEEYEKMFDETWPKALIELKRLCEH